MPALTESQRKQLLSNPNVLKITKTNINFTPEFKLRAVKAYMSGQNPDDFFKSEKFDLSFFKEDYARHSVRRWAQALEKNGIKSLKEENRGKKATGRPKKRKFKTLEEELSYLRMENFLLKKLRALAVSKSKKDS